MMVTDYDIVIIDLFDNDNVKLTADDATSLKGKSNGGSRLVIAYMSIGGWCDMVIYSIFGGELLCHF